MCAQNRLIFCIFLLTTSISTKAVQDQLQRIRYQEYVRNPNGQYKYGYLTDTNLQSQTRDSDGITRGYYSYVDDNGETQYVQYIAGTDGFKVQGTTVPVHVHKKITDTPEVQAARKAHEKAYMVIRHRDLEAQRKHNTQDRKSKDFDTNSVSFNFFNVAPWMMAQVTTTDKSSSNRIQPEFNHFGSPYIVATINTSGHQLKKDEEYKNNQNKDKKHGTVPKCLSDILSNIAVARFQENNHRPQIPKVNNNTISLQPVRYKDIEVKIESSTEKPYRNINQNHYLNNDNGPITKLHTTTLRTFKNSSVIKYSNVHGGADDVTTNSTTLRTLEQTHQSEDLNIHDNKRPTKLHTIINNSRKKFFPTQDFNIQGANQGTTQYYTTPDNLETPYYQTQDLNIHRDNGTAKGPTKLHSSENTSAEQTFEYAHGRIEYPTLPEFLSTNTRDEIISQSGKASSENMYRIETTTQSKPIFEVLYNQKNQTLKNTTRRASTEKTLTSHEIDLINYKRSHLDHNMTKAL